MLTFLANNIGTIIVLAVIAVVVALIIVKMRRDKKRGKNSCGADCACCPSSGMCRGNNNQHTSK